MTWPSVPPVEDNDDRRAALPEAPQLPTAMTCSGTRSLRLFSAQEYSSSEVRSGALPSATTPH